LPDTPPVAYEAFRTWPKLAMGTIAMAAVATNRAESPRCDLASDPIRMIFPPNAFRRRSIAGVAGTFSCRRPAGTESACKPSRHDRDKIQNKFAAKSATKARCSCLAARLRRPSEQTIGPVPAEKPELAANTE